MAWTTPTAAIEKPRNTSTTSLTSTPDSRSSIEQEARAVHLWSRMVGMFGPLWTAKMGEQPFRRDVEPRRLTVVADTWVKGLALVSNEAIATALETLRTSGRTMPPVFPEFLVMCYPLPTVDDVHNYICGRGDLHPFMVMVARYMEKRGRGTFHYRQADARQAERMLRNAYEACRADVMRGVPMPELPPRLEKKKPVRTPASPETVAAAKAAVAAHYAATEPTPSDDTTGA